MSLLVFRKKGTLWVVKMWTLVYHIFCLDQLNLGVPYMWCGSICNDWVMLGALKGILQWNRQCYFPIWIVSSVHSDCFSNNFAPVELGIESTSYLINRPHLFAMFGFIRLCLESGQHLEHDASRYHHTIPTSNFCLEGQDQVSGHKNQPPISYAGVNPTFLSNKTHPGSL
jgi:hypothetical protein